MTTTPGDQLRTALADRYRLEQMDPMLDYLRSDPRFSAAVKRAGL